PSIAVSSRNKLNSCSSVQSQRDAHLTEANQPLHRAAKTYSVRLCSRRIVRRRDARVDPGDAFMQPEPIYDLAHLGHLELLTPKPDESEKFFVDVMGMTVSGRQGDSVYLRGWDDYERYSMKLTAS